MSWTENKAISLPRMVIPVSSSVRVSCVGIVGLGQVFISSLSASSNHPCWHLETAKHCGPQRKRYLSGQRGDTGLFYTPSLHLIQYLSSLAGRCIFFLPIFLSSVIPKKLQGSFTSIRIATFYLLLLKIKRKSHYGFSGCPMLLSAREQE